MDGIRTSFHAVEHDGVAVINRTQDCEPVLSEAAALRAVGATGAGTDMHHVARFPRVVVEKYCNETGITFREWLQNADHARRMLNDPALAGFRVHEGQA